jgi:CRP/FNR family transcriptional regulator
LHKKEIELETGEKVVKSGDPVTHFLYLQTGLLKLFSESESQREQIISIARPRDFIGLLTIFSDKQHRYSISAIVPSRLCMIEIECINRLVDNNGPFARELLTNMSMAVDHILKDSYNLRSLQLRGRIAYVLNDFANDIFESNNFDLPLSRKEIGQMIGMSTENVIRIFSEFRNDHIIQIEGKRISILDPEKLRFLAMHG